jgi:hypothetical protein
LDGGENQFDGPLGRQALGFKRVGQAQTTHHDVGGSGVTTIELVFHMLALGDMRAWGQQGQFLGHQLAMQIGRSYFIQHHAQLAAKKTRKRNF